MSYDGTMKFDTKMETGGFQKGANRLGDIVKGMGVFKLLSAGVSMVSASVDKAMGRIDTMEQFGRVMTTMTGDVELTNKALADTKEIVTGTAYGLDVAAKSVQNFVSRGMQVQDATDTVRAWGDAVAFYGDGSNATFASVTDALSKMQTKGNVTMEHMEMLLNAGIPAIEMYGDAVGMTASEVTDAMSKGELKASDFVGTLNTAMAQGTAKFPALAGAAKKAGASWSGTFDNMRAAITRGVQNIISAIDDTQAALGRPTMREGIANFGKAFEKVLNLIAKAIPPLIKNLDLIAIGVAAVGVSIAGLKAGPIILSLVQGFQSAMVQVDLYKKSVQAAAAADAIQTAGLTVKQAIVGLVTHQIGLATAATQIWHAVLKANPIGGWVTLIAAAVAGIAALITAMIKWDVAASDQRAEVEALCEAQKNLTDAIKASQEAYEKNMAAMEDSTKSTNTLLASLKALAGKERRSAADKQLLTLYVNKLNDAQEGLNLTYDEQADLLSMDVDRLEAYLSAKQEIERFTASIERQNELLTQQLTLEEDLATAKKKQAEINAQFAAGELSQWQYNDQIKDINASVQQYVLDQQGVADDLAAINEQIANTDTAAAQTVIQNAEEVQAAATATAQATEEEMKRRQDAIASFTEAATDMFSAINTKSDVSAEQMLANLKSNRKAMEDYAANMETLRDRFTELGLDDAVLEQFAAMGTEGIAYVAALAKGTDETLQEIAPAWAENVTAGTAAGVASYQAGYPDIEAAAAGANDAAVDGLEDSRVRVEKEIENVVVNVKAAATEQVEASNFPTIGEMITAGIAEGIRNGASGIVEAAIEAVNAAMEAAREAADIHSPSRRARREIGRPWAQGVGLGIVDETDSVAAHAVEMLSEINAAAARGAFGPEGVSGVIRQFRAAVDYNHSLPGARGGTAAAAIQVAAPAAYGPVSNNQTFNFYQPVETPDETARAIRLQMTYGLAGDVD